MSFFNIDIPVLSDIARALNNLGQFIYNGFVWISTQIISIINIFIEKIKEGAMWIFNQIANAIKGFIDWVIGGVQGIVNQISIGVGNLLQNAFGYASTLVNNILQGITQYAIPWLSALPTKFARASMRSLSTYYSLKAIRSSLMDDLPRFIESQGIIRGSISGFVNMLIKTILPKFLESIVENSILSRSPSYGFYTEPPTPPPIPQYITISAQPGVPLVSSASLSYAFIDSISANDTEYVTQETSVIAKSGEDFASVTDNIYITIRQIT